MKIVNLATMREISLAPNDVVSCALGNFDGVHLGHQELLKTANTCPNGEKSAVWTFSEPSSHMMGASLLSSLDERLAMFKSLGIDLVFLTDFSEARNTDASQFVTDILYQACHVRRAVCGFNFHYGYKAAGTAETLQAEMAKLGAETVIVPPYSVNGEIVSSTAIREAIAVGEMEKATAMLSKPYAVTAPVEHGKKLGRTLGFPTANQIFPKERAVPKYGVYTVYMTVDGKKYGGVCNVGIRPTVENTENINCETYLLHYDGDLYGKTVKTEFLHFLRPEKKFENKEALQQAVHQNIAQAMQYFKEDKGIL